MGTNREGRNNIMYDRDKSGLQRIEFCTAHVRTKDEHQEGKIVACVPAYSQQKTIAPNGNQTIHEESKVSFRTTGLNKIISSSRLDLAVFELFRMYAWYWLSLSLGNYGTPPLQQCFRKKVRRRIFQRVLKAYRKYYPSVHDAINAGQAFPWRTQGSSTSNSDPPIS
jgi:hypothetical protein